MPFFQNEKNLPKKSQKELHQRIQAVTDWNERTKAATWGIPWSSHSESIFVWMEKGFGLAEVGKHGVRKATD